MSILKCECGGDTKTIDSRKSGLGEYGRRRKECRMCGKRFSTIEVPLPDRASSGDIAKWLSRASRDISGEPFVLGLITDKNLLDELAERLEQR